VTIRKLLYWLPTLAWMAVIFNFSAQPSLHASEVAWQDFVIKKLAHFSEYFILALLVFISLRKSTRLNISHSLLISLVWCILYAASDEFHQIFTPGRQPQVRDVLIDVSGSFVSLLLARKVNQSPID
jgi:VanZ family protein